MAPYRYQMARTWTMTMTIYNVLLPDALGMDTPLGRGFRLGCTVGTVALLTLPRMPDLASLLRRCAVVLIVVQSIQVFYSPQFIIWLLPFLLPLTSRHPPLFWLLALLDVLTIMTFPLGAARLPACTGRSSLSGSYCASSWQCCFWSGMPWPSSTERARSDFAPNRPGKRPTQDRAADPYKSSFPIRTAWRIAMRARNRSCAGGAGSIWTVPYRPTLLPPSYPHYDPQSPRQKLFPFARSGAPPACRPRADGLGTGGSAVRRFEPFPARPGDRPDLAGHRFDACTLEPHSPVPHRAGVPKRHGGAGPR